MTTWGRAGAIVTCMTALTDVPAGRPSGTRCPRRTQPLRGTTVAADPGEGQWIQRAGRLVAGRYRLQSLLGRGGMGLVWLAEDQLLDRPVALKQAILDDPMSEESRKTALLRALGEARAAARVRHNGVVDIYDVVKEDGRPWIVMELLSGRTLAERLHTDGPLPIGQATRVGLRLLDVLRATHRVGIVHGDVKPGNVQLCDNGRVVLTDFGVACATGEDSHFPGHVFAGSPAYVSPERLRGERPSPGSDLFSLGATLFTAVEGRSPFDKGDLVATLTAVAEDAPAPSRRAGSMRPVIEGLLAKEPDRRLNADQAQTALRAVLRDRPALTTDHHRHTTTATT
jgi:serine/threonine protein kinase